MADSGESPRTAPPLPGQNNTMKNSTQNKVEGAAKDLKGKAREAAGNVTRDPKMRDEGRADQAEGKVQKKVGDVQKVFNQ